MNDSLWGLTIAALGVSVLFYLWTALALAAVFRKAGIAPWKGWVPVVNMVTLLQLGGFSGWLVLLALIPVFGGVLVYVTIVVAAHHVNRAFGWGGGMTVVAALFFPIWATILGFGSARWLGHSDDHGPVRAPDGGSESGSRESLVLPPLLTEPRTPQPDHHRPTVDRDFGAGLSASPVPEPVHRVPDEDPVVTPDAGAIAEPPMATDAEDQADLDALFGQQVTAEHSADDDASSRDREVPSVAPARATDSDSGLGSEPAPELEPAPESVSRAEPMRGGSDVESRGDAGETSEEDDEDPIAHVSLTDWWRPAPATTPDSFPELSDEVSAISSAPSAGAPRSALSSVSARFAENERPEPGVVFRKSASDPATDPASDPAAEPNDDGFDETVISRRKRTSWRLIDPAGHSVELDAEVVIVGRRPQAQSAYPGAQLVAIEDDTRTVSKSHAALFRRDEVWFIKDLHSTNGVLFASMTGTEVELPPGAEAEAGEAFLLGDAEVRLVRLDG